MASPRPPVPIPRASQEALPCKHTRPLLLHAYQHRLHQGGAQRRGLSLHKASGATPPRPPPSPPLHQVPPSPPHAGTQDRVRPHRARLPGPPPLPPPGPPSLRLRHALCATRGPRARHTFRTLPHHCGHHDSLLLPPPEVSRVGLPLRRPRVEAHASGHARQGVQRHLGRRQILTVHGSVFWLHRNQVKHSYSTISVSVTFIYVHVFIRTFKEVESDRIDYVSSLVCKEVVPVGPLIPDAYLDEEGHQSSRKVMDFMGEKDNSSVVFASLGSEYFLSEEEMEEISMGLELSKVSFIWVIRFPKAVGEEEEEEESVKPLIPCGFMERTRDVGLVLTGWAPQREILTHPSIGGFLSHCGWSSVMEAMRFGVPMVALPMQLDQPINAKLVVELGIAVEVMIGNSTSRDECSRMLKGEDVAKGIRDVMVNEEGHGVRMKAKVIAEMMARKGNEEIENLVGKMAMLCTKHQQREITL
ncbi:flavanone 7-O-glucoside 2''-O-beta-L-rhamnosyltransferase-like [Iris pallida]|uniref:Glycosyltransferase n=1 Tax=Iris pallida TaxID=29817 RepID=A0AAX6IEP7_IRIPA|nr:flavanone 7-O-glucoside 2''-O-beta-L-rhamnosyltransferase-like [Iris pallida]